MNLQTEIKPRRPILRYHGGKWRLAPWIINHFPEHTRYVEPFCGAASVLLKKPRSYAEVINDLNDQVVNLFKVLQDPDLSYSLINRIQMTPYARLSFDDAKAYSQRPVKNALNFLIRSHMGYNTAAKNTGFRSNTSRKCSIPAHNWADMDYVLEATISRLKGVVIEKAPAEFVMKKHDCENTLHFVDPPYLPSTRTPTSQYVNDMTEDQHYGLLQALLELKGMVILCGYQSEMYDSLLVNRNGWHRIEKQTYTANKKKRIECLWLNPHCQQRLKAQQ
ncbi:MAG: DNA adenine methylase [OCS116 cluster bacterium]|nr:DNA adenine methylase [OCS116 cluster bacterium]